MRTEAGRSLLRELELAGKPNERLLSEQVAAVEREAWLAGVEASQIERVSASVLPLDERALAQAIDTFITANDGFDVDDAEAIAALYLRYAAESAVPR